jgi:hypothetical protein
MSSINEAEGQGISDTAICCKDIVSESLLHAPSSAIMSSAILSAMSTFLPTIIANFGFPLEYSIRIFTIIYFLSLPLVVSTLYELRFFTISLLRACSSNARIDIVPFIVGALPLGFIAALYYIEYVLQGSCEKLRGKYKVSPIDLFVNIAVFGLHAVIYARIFNYIVDNIIPSICEEN